MLQSVRSHRQRLALSILACVLLTVCMQTLHAASRLGARHVYILEPMLDPEAGPALRLTYIFSVESDAAEAQSAQVQPSLPKHVDDFRVLEGVPPEAVRTEQSGAVVLSHAFNAGSTMVAMGLFKRAEGNGSVQLEIPIFGEGQSFDFLWSDPSLALKGSGLTQVEDTVVGDRPFKKASLAIAVGSDAAKAFEVQVEGLPQGRSSFQELAIAFAVLLVLASAVIAWFTRPRKAERNALKI